MTYEDVIPYTPWKNGMKFELFRAKETFSGSRFNKNMEAA
jgi:hypothetical protein